jgi:hypothetical protein
MKITSNEKFEKRKYIRKLEGTNVHNLQTGAGYEFRVSIDPCQIEFLGIRMSVGKFWTNVRHMSSGTPVKKRGGGADICRRYKCIAMYGTRGG